MLFYTKNHIKDFLELVLVEMSNGKWYIENTWDKKEYEEYEHILQFEETIKSDFPNIKSFPKTIKYYDSKEKATDFLNSIEEDILEKIMKN